MELIVQLPTTSCLSMLAYLSLFDNKPWNGGLVPAIMQEWFPWFVRWGSLLWFTRYPSCFGSLLIFYCDATAAIAETGGPLARISLQNRSVESLKALTYIENIVGATEKRHSSTGSSNNLVKFSETDGPLSCERIVQWLVVILDFQIINQSEYLTILKVSVAFHLMSEPHNVY